MDLSAEDHIRTQAAIQRWVDSSISKTANCPADFTVEETKRLYELAFELGCKGVTIYRDGSRDVQVLQTEKKDDKAEANENVNSSESGAAAGAPAGAEGPAAGAEQTALNGLDQTLSAGVDPSEKTVFDKQYKKRPQVLHGATYKINTPFGMAYITIND